MLVQLAKNGDQAAQLQLLEIMKDDVKENLEPRKRIPDGVWVLITVFIVGIIGGIITYYLIQKKKTIEPNPKVDYENVVPDIEPNPKVDYESNPEVDYENVVPETFEEKKVQPPSILSRLPSQSPNLYVDDDVNMELKEYEFENVVPSKSRRRGSIPENKSINLLRALDLPEYTYSKLSNKNVEDCTNRLYSYASDTGNENLDRLQREAPPTSGIKVRNKDFYFSDVYLGISNYLSVIMYIENNKEIVARLIYRSNSDGGWRVSPFYGREGYNKGDCHYTQGTKPHFFIVTHLESITPSYEIKDNSEEVIENAFWGTKQSISRWGEESKCIVLPQILGIFQTCSPGDCFGSKSNMCDILRREKKTFTEYIQEINDKIINGGDDLKRFIPNFSSHPRFTYKITHTLLSAKGKGNQLVADVTVQMYLGYLEDEPVEWHMATSKEGQIWIDRIRYAFGNLNSYGTDSKVINTGILTNKPIEYNKQSNCLIDNTEKIDTREVYNNITPLLRGLLPIQLFIAKTKLD